MNDEYEFFKSLKKEQGKSAKDRRTLNMQIFEEARKLAYEHGMILIQHTDVHYTLSANNWRLNLYPGNQRLYHDKKHKKPPFLEVPENWTLKDIVDACIKEV